MTSGAQMSALEVTDREGRFVFRNLPPGEYRLYVGGSGYEPANLPVSLSRGEVRSDIIFRITPHASVAGVVLDDLGEPLRGANVFLFRRAWERGRPVLSMSGVTSTDDRGQYRLYNVKAGSYYLAAKADLQVPVDSSGPGQVYSIQFWRGSDSTQAATLLSLAPGREMRGLDFNLRFARTATIKGRVIGFPGGASQGERALFRLVPRDGVLEHSLGHDHNPADWTYRFTNVLPGTYRLVALYTAGGNSYRAVAPVDVAGGEELQIELAAHPAVPLAGRINGDVPLSSVTVRLVAADGLPGYLGSPAEAVIKPDGSFRFAGVLPGIWDISVRGLPKGAYIASMTLGETDVLRGDMTINPSTTDTLNIVLSSRGAKVEGETAPDATVLLAPEAKYRRNLGMYHLVAADAKGQFAFDGIAPGSYTAFAFDAMDVNEWQDPAFLVPYGEHVTSVQVKESDAIKIKTPVIKRADR
jgi:protocatechuate 3,4-dioxygenase beta subunit